MCGRGARSSSCRFLTSISLNEWRQGELMKFTETRLLGVFLISIEPHEDERGFFARAFCKKEFEAMRLCTEYVQCNLSFNKKRGTLRGMHFQKHPYEEVKVVSCMKGAIYDVVLDIREDSPTQGEWIAAELTEENHQMLYIPKGLAHGFQTLADDSLVYYQMGQFYTPGAGSGIRYDDEHYGIRWPVEQKIMSEQDRSWGRADR